MSAIKSYFYVNGASKKNNVTTIVRPSPPSPPVEKATPRSDWSLTRPRTWGKKTIISIVILAIIVIVAAVVPAVIVTKNRPKGYPDYSKINYKLQDTYAGITFFDQFDYFTDTDPTRGFVDYVGSQVATTGNLTYSSATSATIRVDSTTKLATSGRESIRLVSKKAYNNGLFIFDVAHVPYGCGTWPAIWMTSLQGWPAHGEIDIMETVNQGATGNQMTLHTSQGCTVDGQRNQSGTALTTNCWVGTSSGDSCAVRGTQNSAGQAFNAIGGGVYAMEWRYEGIRMWFFERSKIPSNIDSPDPSTWPVASADFPNSNCDISSHFADLHIITNIALCGVWAGAESVYNEQDYCPGSCTGFVANNATAFDQAYFTFNSFKTYSAT